jgi:hypothetical protein
MTLFHRISAGMASCQISLCQISGNARQAKAMAARLGVSAAMFL